MSLQPGCRELGGPRGAQAPFLRVMGTAGEAGMGPVTDTCTTPNARGHLWAWSGLTLHHGQPEPGRAARDSAPQGSTMSSLWQWPEDDRRTPRSHARQPGRAPCHLGSTTSVATAPGHSRPDTAQPRGPCDRPQGPPHPAPCPALTAPGAPSITACSSSFLPCFPHPRGRERHEELASARGCLKHLVKKTNRSFFYCLLK